MVARPLVLKSQIGRSSQSVAASIEPIARVWVDTGVFHLDSHFDYLISENISAQVRIGVRVEVPFGPSFKEGIVVDRLSVSDSAGKLKHISKVLSPHPVASIQSLTLIDAVARRWSANRYDVVRSAIPPRVQSIDRAYRPSGSECSHNGLTKTREIPSVFSEERVRAYWSMPKSNGFSALLAELIRVRKDFGQVLVVVPDEWSLESLQREISKILPNVNSVRIDGQILRSERYLNFLQALNHDVDIIFGMRGAIFTPLVDRSTVIVVGESSHHLYEVRTPGWNARDIALMRARTEEVSVVLTGYSPSLEAALAIDEAFLALVSSKKRTSVQAFDSTQGELLPSRVFPLVKNALKGGPVLFLVPSKGYGNAVLCGKCRNIALCSCGGKLQKGAAHAPPQCTLCAAKYPDWRCTWCQSDRIYIAARGIDRFAEEIGRAFPNISLINSSGDHIVREIPSSKALVVATPGAMPRAVDGYSAVVLLQGTRFFGHSDLRSLERARNLFFETSAYASETGQLCAVIDNAHPIVAALSLWDPTRMARNELAEMKEAELPPYWRLLILEVDSSEAIALTNGLRRALAEGRIPSQSKVFGPFQKDGERSSITISSPIDRGQEMIDFIHELQRKRSISRKSLFSINVDPYSLG